jgi:rod shape-determining protein MreD
MSSSRSAPHLGFWISLLVALVLQLVLLPESLAGFRPLWLPLVLSYWALTDARLPTLLASFAFGIGVDVLLNAVLGQHALAFVLLTYLVIKLRGLFAVFPLWQSTVGLVPLWLIYAFLMFWIDGVAHHRSDPWLRWTPVVSTTLFWPVIYGLLDSYVRRRQRRQEE